MTHPNDLIRQREQPTYLARSEDPRKRFQHDSQIVGNPLKHTTTVYDRGMQTSGHEGESALGAGLRLSRGR
jgi:hypothetical protein